jgi:hypothetical protein
VRIRRSLQVLLPRKRFDLLCNLHYRLPRV